MTHFSWKWVELGTARRHLAWDDDATGSGRLERERGQESTYSESLNPQTMASNESSKLSAEEKYELITRSLQEVLGADIIKSILAERDAKGYWGAHAVELGTRQY